MIHDDMYENIFVHELVSGFMDLWIETDVEAVEHALCNANDLRNRVSVVLDLFLNSGMGKYR